MDNRKRNDPKYIAAENAAIHMVVNGEKLRPYYDEDEMMEDIRKFRDEIYDASWEDNWL